MSAPKIEWNEELGRLISDTPIKWYAFVIDGEVVFTQYVDVKLDYLVAVMSSKPVVIEVPEPYAGMVKEGWRYDVKKDIDGSGGFYPVDPA
jgi:hypothetical protein